MEIKKEKKDNKMTAYVSGKIDTSTSEKFLSTIENDLDSIDFLTLDFSNLDYISSSGLRVLLMLYKKMIAKNGKMILTGCNEIISEIFDITGFSDIFNIA